MQPIAAMLGGLALCIACLASTPVLAQTAASLAEDAMDQILFDQDASDFVVYRIVNFGYVEVTFPSNTPRDVANRILDAARKSPNISGVRENFRGAACSRF